MTEIRRETKETKIEVKLEINGSGKSNISTGVGFFDHMLEALAKHSGMDLEVFCDGDIYVDYHHTVEDVGIVLGEALFNEVYPVQNIERYANAVAILDEAAVEVDLDIGGRPYLVYDLPREGMIKDFDMELVEEFFKSLVFNFKIAAHIIYKRGTNKHHIVESAFKSFAVALRRALSYRESGIPSTKGII
ncbi:imidazoleglycerol-phosphate dehydratase [Nautilia profundicola AmH]|uniref:Imidazoleglycerol-phosphate dehydratase n=1 Tax=Nautilia profundicola (strain ATCC BAA-1463 / DSM 18972 / AmH) TaxID=598659 RepID=HIS7_NAUPA|nr:imidazoleglycerol-phosphate dehydratase HisB [Nautilia profundicola]B9LAD4.1 RecName: Full=Imidazoleglycerol-phosphate dehydratase; Short=IGPD [Nautilia profundicola AmH]ACM92276.1 imidazoleglycerol-phosphate dehydratase [Nautilia profundicola AmH]